MLNNFRRNAYSQWGEDGILEEIFRVLRIKKGTFVEFGAWDGIHLSNTANLTRGFGWNGLLIEGDPQRFEQLRHNYAPYVTVELAQHIVGLEGDYTFDNIVKREHPTIPHDFDLLSIDIDGCDYHVWETITFYRPKIVVIEFNPTIPLEVSFVQPRDLTVYQGSSLEALCRLGRRKAYDLIACTDTNAVFATADLSYHFSCVNRPEQLWVDRHKYVTHIFSLYDGTVKLTGAKKLPWHGQPLDEEMMQVLPEHLRKFPGAL